MLLHIYCLTVPGGTPYNGLYGVAPPEGEPFSGFEYIKGLVNLLLRYNVNGN